MSLGAWENQDWLTEYDWGMEMDYKSPNHYDWNGSQIPLVIIGKFEAPPGSAIYRRRLRKEYFDYFYQTGKEHIFLLGRDQDNDGGDDELIFSMRRNDSYMAIKDKKGLLLDSGNRIGGQYQAEHPLVGIWDVPENPSEFRFVEPANYGYYLEISKNIPGF